MIKPYTVTVYTYDNTVDYEVVGYFPKDRYFVMELADGGREMILHETIEKIHISKEWKNED